MTNFTKYVIGYSAAVVSTGVAVAVVYGTYADHKTKTDQIEYSRKINERNYQDAREVSDRERQAKEDYWNSLTPEGKAEVETNREITKQEELKAKTQELKTREAEATTKSKLTQFKTDILKEVRSEAIDHVNKDASTMFNDWSRDTTAKIDRRISKLEDRVKDLEDANAKLERKIKSLERDVDELDDRIDDSSSNQVNQTTPVAPASPVITVAPVIGK